LSACVIGAKNMTSDFFPATLNGNYNFAVWITLITLLL